MEGISLHEDGAGETRGGREAGGWNREKSSPRSRQRPHRIGARRQAAAAAQGGAVRPPHTGGRGEGRGMAEDTGGGIRARGKAAYLKMLLTN